MREEKTSVYFYVNNLTGKHSQCTVDDTGGILETVTRSTPQVS